MSRGAFEVKVKTNGVGPSVIGFASTMAVLDSEGASIVGDVVTGVSWMSSVRASWTKTFRFPQLAT